MLVWPPGIRILAWLMVGWKACFQGAGLASDGVEGSASERYGPEWGMGGEERRRQL